REGQVYLLQGPGKPPARARGSASLMTQTEGKTYEWQNTQDAEYLQLCIDRLSQPPLRWIRQFVTLIDEDARTRGDSSISVNDLGCCVGGYAGGIKELATVPVDYVGHDI